MDKNKTELAMEDLKKQQEILDYDTKEFSIKHLVERLINPGEDIGPDLYVPSYHREFSWGVIQQSRFIESLLIGLPGQLMYFADMDDGRFELIDGLQRLSACALFLSNKLELRGLERVRSLDGLRFSDLPRMHRRRFKRRSIRCVILSHKPTEKDRRDLFNRINPITLENGDQDEACAPQGLPSPADDQ